MQAVSDKLLDAYKVGLTIVKIFSKEFKRLHERIWTFCTNRSNDLATFSANRSNGSLMSLNDLKNRFNGKRLNG
jgi:hypothetical protein